VRAKHLVVRLRRSSRVWRLTVRNGLRYVLMRVRGRAASAEKRAELDERFAIRTARDVAEELGHMKGVVMKAGQLISVIAETLPDDAQAALATLQADAPPMAPSLAAGVVADELGAPPDRIFLDWPPEPTAAASIGQVHRATTRDGRLVAVKVQYPGVGEAIAADLGNAEAMYGLLSAFALKGIDPKAIVDELRSRMTEELDYRLEAANQLEFATAFAGHPSVRVPRLVEEYSTGRVLTSEWVDGWTFDELLAHGDPVVRQRAAETVWRFAQYAIFRLGAFNGDPHPGNYRFHDDGSVTFLDFGMVKRWDAGEWELLRPCLDGIIVERDPVATVRAMVDVGFLPADHGLDPEQVFGYVSAPYAPYLVDEFTFTRAFMKETLTKITDVRGPFGPVLAKLDLPTSFVVLNRVVWGLSALLGRLDAHGPWRRMLLEYRLPDAIPATPLGAAEAAWSRGHTNGTRGHGHA
jgi:predicted unusual protein kinase regulating ubiquinone biosynthesis (AarF/ABC1/UbiB family)